MEENNNNFEPKLKTKVLEKTPNDFIFEVKNIIKEYPGVKALDGVSFKVKRKSILSIIGENGAGKSTLLKVMTGVIPFGKYQGGIYFNNEEARFRNINSSKDLGIAIIHQELSISPFLSVYENIFIDHFESKFGVLKRNQMIKMSRKFLDQVGLKNVSPLEQANRLSVAQQQLIEIAKALSKNISLLILDEPTSSLSDEDSYRLLDILIELKKEGITSVIVSHKLKEIEYVADSIVVIRDGKYISDYDNTSKQIDENRLIKDLVGRELNSRFPDKPKRLIGKEILRVKDVVVPHPRLRGIVTVKKGFFDVKKGEIVGISGLVGSGRSEFILSVFGSQYGKISQGEIIYKGKKVRFRTPRDAIKQGVMLATEDRKNTGLIQIFDINTNISSASLDLLSFYKILNNKKIVINSQKLSKQLGVKVPNITYKVNTLSGGNQQKVVIAKALSTNFDVLIIDEPTKGIDVGSKYEIYKILFDLAAQGKAIVIISSEIEELLGTTDRIFVMSRGSMKGVIDTKDATQEKIISMSLSSRTI